MKRTIIAVLIAASLLSGCGSNTTLVDSNPENAGRFKCEHGDVSLITDTKTGCQYLAWHEYNKGGVTLLVDQYGYPLLADGYSRVDVGMSEDDGE